MRYKYEFIRKLIHLSNLVIPLSLFYYDRQFVLILLIPLSVSFIVFDCLRINSRKVATFYNKYFFLITRDFEENQLTGASYVFFSSCIIIFIFPKAIAIPSLLIMSISDSVAALIGQKYGEIKLFNKTLEGSIAFFLSSILIIVLLPDIMLIPALIGAIVSTIIESSNFLDINDNLSVPLSFAVIYFLLEYILIRGAI